MVDSVDAGWRLSLAGLAGETLQRWDQRGSHWRTRYDPLLRPVAIEENAQPNVETFAYADASADPDFNLRCQLTEQLDRSGTLSVDSYSLLGQPLGETRTLIEATPYRSRRTLQSARRGTEPDRRRRTSATIALRPRRATPTG